MLYLVPTPIGNLKDITYRSVEILQASDLILAEDTRQAAKLLSHYDIKTPMRPFHAHNEHRSVDYIVELLQGGQTISLISDAGSPGISDPGFLISRACMEAGIQVIALPGATAFVPALTASGLPSDRFHFEGFLPHKKGRQTRWKYLATLDHTFILYESPYRIIKCVEEIIKYCGEGRLVCFAREISKMYEEVLTLPAPEMLDNLKARPSIKGEFVVVVSSTRLRPRSE